MSKITLTPIELDDGTTNSNNLVNSNKIVVYVPKATEETEGTVKLTDITSIASDLIDAHNAVNSGAHTNKQDKTDISLNTTSKTVVGAINELDTRLDNIDNDVDNKISQHNQANDSHSDIRTTLSGKVDKTVTSGDIQSSVVNSGSSLAIQLAHGTTLEDFGMEGVSLEEGKIKISSGKSGVGESKIELTPTTAKLNDVQIPVAKNSATTSTIDTYSVDYLNSQFTSVTEVAEGKTTAYTISYSEPNNIDFNSSNNTITLSVSATITDTLNNTIDLSDLKVGDIIYVIETDVPDRWVGSKDSSNIIFYIMETSKPDLSSKVDKTTGTYKLYGTDSSGNQTTLPYDTYPAGSFVRRDGSSQITVPLTPTANGNAASKKYVDDSLQIFICTYGTTTFSDVTSALADNKLPICYYNNRCYVYGRLTNNQYIFVTSQSDSLRFAVLNNSDVWSTGSTMVESTTNKVTSLSNDSTDTQYPSAKCVYDELIDKQDVIQYSTMPTASASNEGQIVQFTGTTGTYTNGHFYKCVEDNGSYDWEEILYGTPNAVTTDTAQTITGKKTIDNEMTFTNSGAAGTNNLSIKNDNGYNAKIKMGSTENMRLMTGGTYFGTTAGVTIDNSFDLGVSNAAWKDFYLKGKIDFGDNATISKDSSSRVTIKYNDTDKVKVGSLDTLFSNRVTPDTNNTYDLGRSGVYWKDLYLAGNITDGTNTIAVANIMDETDALSDNDIDTIMDSILV